MAAATKKSRTGSASEKVTEWDSPMIPGIMDVAEGIKGAVVKEPFPHWVLHDIFHPEFLKACKSELSAASFNEKNNDLYQFQQTDSLTAADSGALLQLRETLYSPKFVQWMSTVSGIPLNGTIDMSSAVYDDTSYLLCHDDDLSERRIAYILYLVPPTWSSSHGGTLDLYSADASGAPDVVVKSVVPRFNTLAFFEVSHLSFHQVAEVLAAVPGGRMSISGWFHGPPLQRPAPALPPSPKFFAPWTLEDGAPVPPQGPTLGLVGEGTDSEGDEDGPPQAGDISPLAALAVGPASASAYSQMSAYTSPQDVWSLWVHSMYSSKPTRVLPQMSAAFNASGVLQLENFLAPSALTDVMSALPLTTWQHVAPANLQHYRRSATSGETEARGRGLLQSTMLNAAQNLEVFLQSAAFIQFLAAATGQDIEAVRVETRAFGHRDYTMICDPEYLAARTAAKRTTVAQRSGKAASAAAGEGEAQGLGASGAGGGYAPSTVLEVTLCLPQVTRPGGEVVDEEGEWALSTGGYMTYLTSDEEVLTVPVKPNTLSIVAKPPGLYSFVKYVNHTAPGIRFDVAAQYALAEEE